MSLKSCYTSDKLEAGCDEVGRGCLAGPVVAAAVILPKDYEHRVLTDSKQLSKSHREAVREDILRDALAWAIAEIDNHEIDRTNILKASIRAMHLALDQLTLRPEFILVDGNKFHPYGSTPHLCVVKGDSHYLSIAAASVLAKVHRDKLMGEFSHQYPHYRWEKNAGYGTTAHRQAIVEHGITPLHRRSFSMGNRQLGLFSDQ